MTTNYIGADVDSRTTNLAVERNGRIVQELCVPTTIPALRAALESIRRPRELTLEEGPMASWLARGLKDSVDRLVVCDPYHNGLISRDGDADDLIDARKLATLLRGNFLREVYHSDDPQRVLLKQWVGIYQDRVRDGVRQVNKIRARCLQHGLWPPRGALRNPGRREAWLKDLGAHPAVEQLQVLFIGFDAAAQQVELSRRQIVRRSRPYKIIGFWQALPGVGPIRAITLFAYLDTPWRFDFNRHKLWKYCGVGIERSSSGKDRNGRPKVGFLQLAWRVNRQLKSAVMGAAFSAIQQGGNPFAAQHERLVHEGVSTGNARHTVARKMLYVMWGMWKNESAFDPQRV